MVKLRALKKFEKIVEDTVKSQNECTSYLSVIFVLFKEKNYF